MSPVKISTSGNSDFSSINLPSFLAIVRTFAPKLSNSFIRGFPKKPEPPVTKTNLFFKLYFFILF